MDHGSDLSSAYGGGRVSGQRRIVAEAAAALDGAFTVERLAEAARSVSPRIGTATVYRAVAALLRSGYLEQVGSRAGCGLYVWCDRTAHHHHLVCTGCGAVAEADCPLDSRSVRRAEAAGYVITGHEVTIYALCPACAAAGPAEAGASSARRSRRAGAKG